MSKQQSYQSLNNEVPNGEDYGFAARLPQASGSQPVDNARDADMRGTGTSGGVGVTNPVAYPPAAYPPAAYPPAGYPPAAYGGAPAAGYPAMPMNTGPVGMVVQDPMGMYGRNACDANGCRGCRRCRRRRGPVSLVFRLARSAYKSVQKHQKQKQAPALKPTSS